MIKNEETVIAITDIGAKGEGIGKTEEGYTLFVKDALPGDTCRVQIVKGKKHYGYARLMEVLVPSKDRVDPPCHLSKKCGGCQIMALSYGAQLAFKAEKVREDFVRLGGFSEEEIDDVLCPIEGMENPWRYRNKAQLPVGLDKEGHIVAGFYAGHTHSIIPTADCLIGIEENRVIQDIVLKHMKQYSIKPYDEKSHKGLVRHLLIRKGFSTGEIMVCLVVNGKKLPGAPRLAEKLARVEGVKSVSLCINEKKTNVIMGEEIVNLYGSETITDTIGDVKFEISPLSFFQVNPVQTEKLYSYALDFADLTGKESVFDLYSGLGSISLFLAQKAGKVVGVEIVPDAVRDAKANAKRNGFENTEFLLGRSEDILPRLKAEGALADVIVVDPPRKGCEESLLQTISDMAPERVVYVSCNPSTLARDARILCDADYKLRKVQPVDQFPHTCHVETVCLFERGI